jgi:hypothetical protein
VQRDLSELSTGILYDIFFKNMLFSKEKEVEPVLSMEENDMLKASLTTVQRWKVN